MPLKICDFSDWNCGDISGEEDRRESVFFVFFCLICVIVDTDICCKKLRNARKLYIIYIKASINYLKLNELHKKDEADRIMISDKWLNKKHATVPDHTEKRLHVCFFYQYQI